MRQPGCWRGAADAGDPLGILARFDLAPGHGARTVLHERLTFVPCRAEHQARAYETFRLGVECRVVGPIDLDEWQRAAERGEPIDDGAGDDGATRDALEAERDALRRELAGADAVHDVRAALAEYHRELWSFQRFESAGGSHGHERLAEALARVGAEADVALDASAQRWLAQQELHAHYVREHLGVVEERLAALDGVAAVVATTLPRGTPALLRWLATATPEPVLVLVELADPGDDELVDGLAEVSALRRVVYLTGDVSLLQRAEQLPAEAGAVRDVLVAPTPDVTVAPSVSPAAPTT